MVFDNRTKTKAVAWIASAICLALSVCSTRSAAQTQQTSAPVILYRGNPQRTGVYDTQPVRQAPRVKWRTTLGRIAPAAPVLADGVVYLPTGEGNVHAINASDGREIWSFRSVSEHGVFSSVAVEGDIVYVGTEKKRLHALDRQTGKSLWSFKAKGMIWSSPLVVGDRIFLATDTGNFYAVDKTTRQQVWKRSVPGPALNSPAFADGAVYFSSDKTLFALDPETGREQWRFERTGFWYPPAVSGDLIHAGNEDGFFYTLDRRTGSVAWKSAPSGDGWSSPAVADGIVYVGNKDRNFRAFDAQTGEPLWKFGTEDWAVSDPVVAAGVVYFGVGNHENREGERNLYALDARTGQQLWSFKGDSRFLTAPAIGGGAVYVGSLGGTLYALE